MEEHKWRKQQWIYPPSSCQQYFSTFEWPPFWLSLLTMLASRLQSPFFSFVKHLTNLIDNFLDSSQAIMWSFKYKRNKVEELDLKINVCSMKEIEAETPKPRHPHPHGPTPTPTTFCVVNQLIYFLFFCWFSKFDRIQARWSWPLKWN